MVNALLAGLVLSVAGQIDAGPFAAGPIGVQVSAPVQIAVGAIAPNSTDSAATNPTSPGDSLMVLPSTSGQSTEATQNSQPAPAPGWLMQSLEGTWLGSTLEKNRISVSGWTDASFTASSVSSNNLPLGFNYEANDFLLQQNWLRIDRPVDTSTTTDPSFGFRSDTILPGSDYRFTMARGLFSGQLTANNGQPDLYGIDPIQFYAEAYFPTVAQGMDVKVGRFYAQYGVEQNDAISNNLLSHSYTFVYDPFTHTGVLTSTKLSDVWAVQAGLVLGSDDFINPVDNPTFIGSVKWTQRNDSVLINAIVGSARYNQARNFQNPDVFDAIYTHKFSAKLSTTFEGLFGFTTNAPTHGTAEWFGLVGYVNYALAPGVNSTTRLEFFDDVQGERTQFAGLYTALTTGLQFQPRTWLTLRPEVRFDNNGQSAAFQGQHDLLTASTDVILRW